MPGCREHPGHKASQVAVGRGPGFPQVCFLFALVNERRTRELLEAGNGPRLAFQGVRPKAAGG